jgi:hypothetical protein
MNIYVFDGYSLLKAARAARIVRPVCMRCHILHVVSMTTDSILFTEDAVSMTRHAFIIFFCIANPFRL